MAESAEIQRLRYRARRKWLALHKTDENTFSVYDVRARQTVADNLSPVELAEFISNFSRIKRRLELLGGIAIE